MLIKIIREHFYNKHIGRIVEQIYLVVSAYAQYKAIIYS